MKKLLTVLAVLVFAVVLTQVSVEAQRAPMGKKSDCTAITTGIITYGAGHYLAGQPIKPGVDIFGYNYQAGMFSGSYANVYLGGDGFPPYEGDDAAYVAANPTVVGKWYWPFRADNLIMKWNSAWISNLDCDGDGKLDRHFGFVSYIGSGAWETNHQSGTYVGGDGKEYSWNYFCKIQAVPADAVKVSGIWYAANGDEIGPDIWGEFALIQEVYNDNGTGDHGILYKSPAAPGFGKWK